MADEKEDEESYKKSRNFPHLFLQHSKNICLILLTSDWVVWDNNQDLTVVQVIVFENPTVKNHHKSKVFFYFSCNIQLLCLSLHKNIEAYEKGLIDRVIGDWRKG